MSVTTYYNLAAYEQAAESLARANGLRGETIRPDGSPQPFGLATTNALAHALTSAYLDINYSLAEAYGLGWAREYKSYYLDYYQGQARPDAWDTFKDLYNNQVGRNIAEYAKANGLSDADVQNLVLDALTTGALIVE